MIEITLKFNNVEGVNAFIGTLALGQFGFVAPLIEEVKQQATKQLETKEVETPAE